jgi:hypothetical protein
MQIRIILHHTFSGMFQFQLIHHHGDYNVKDSEASTIYTKLICTLIDVVYIVHHIKYKQIMFNVPVFMYIHPVVCLKTGTYALPK